MSQLGTTLTSWANEMRLTENKTPQILHISQNMFNDDDSLDDPGIFALSEYLRHALGGRMGHDNTNYHKFMNHVIGYALMKAHPRETARIIRDNKQFITVGPRGTPRNVGECTNRHPPSAIWMVATVSEVPPDDMHTASDADAESESDAHGVSFDTTVQMTRIDFDDNQSVAFEESDGTLDYDPVARITAYQDVIMGVYCDEHRIDRINKNWDEELAATQEPGTWATASPPTEIMYEENVRNQDSVGFYNVQEDPQEKDTPTTKQSWLPSVRIKYN
jgi:hypothetical protein